MARLEGVLLLVSLYQVDCFAIMPTRDGSETATPVRCYTGDRWIQPGERTFEGRSGSWCYGFLCDSDGNLVSWDDWNCTSETTPMTVPTTQQPSTQQTGCYTGDRWVKPGERTFEGSSGSWCYGFFCDLDGNLIPWDDWNCTSEVTNHAVPTIQQTSTKKPGCYTGGRWLQPGERTVEGRNESWCYGFLCETGGSLTPWDDWNCTTETTNVIVRTTEQPNTQQSGCYTGSRWLQPGEKTVEGSKGTWCYGFLCDIDGNLISWDDWHCTTDESRVTVPTTLQPSTQKQGCDTGDRWIQLGERTVEGSNGSWCYGFLCDIDGNITPWDDWNCTIDATDVTVHTTQQLNTQQSGCYTGYRWIQPGERTVEGTDGSWCYGFLCAPDGSLTRWDDMNCPA